MYGAMHRGVIGHTVAYSRAAARMLEDLTGVVRSQVSVVENDIDVSRFREQPAPECERLRREMGMGPGEICWLAVGEFRPMKDLPTLLETVGILQSNHPEGAASAKFVSAGSGAVPPAVEQGLVPLRDCVRVLGRRDDVPDLVQACDGFVMSSSEEGQPNVMMEALAAARPVVSTDFGGVSELVSAGQSGLLVPATALETLADAMAAAMAMTDEARAEMGAVGSRRIEERSGIDRLVFERERRLLETTRKGLRRALGRACHAFSGEAEGAWSQLAQSARAPPGPRV